MSSAASEDPPLIRCVALDAVGTVIDADPPVAVAYASVGRRHGSALDREQVNGRLNEAFASCFGVGRANDAERLVSSEDSERAMWRWIVGEVFSDLETVDAADRCFEELYEHFGKAASWRCYDDVAVTMSRIQAAGLDVVIASNFDRRLHAVCSGWPMFRSVRSVVVSSEVGWRKPGRGFFEALVSACGCRAEEVLMVGDDPVNDVEGALACGLQAVRVDRSVGAMADGGHLSGRPKPSVIESLVGLEAWWR